MEVVFTGASRGIGRALALELGGTRVHAVARDADALDELARLRPNIMPRVADLSSRVDAARVGRELADIAAPPIVIVHNAGICSVPRDAAAVVSALCALGAAV